MKQIPKRVFQKALLFSLRFILGALFCVQSLILSIQINGHKINLPETLLRKIENQLSTNDLTIKIASGHITSSGEIRATNISASAKASRIPALTSEQASITLNYLSLLFGKISIQELKIKNTLILCPPVHSPTGLPEPILEIPLASLTYKNQNLIQINQAILKIHNLDILVSGDWSLAPQNEKNPWNLPELVKTGSILLNQQQYLTAFNHPTLYIKTKSLSNSENKIQGVFHAKHFFMEKLFSLGQHKCEFSLKLQNNSFEPDAHILISFNNFQDQKYGTIRRGFVQAVIPTNYSNAKQIKYCDIKFLDIEHNNISADVLEGIFSSINYPLIKGNIKITNDEEWMQGDGVMNIEAQSLKLTISGKINSETASPYLSQIPLLQKFNTEPQKTITLKGNATFGNNFSFKEGLVQVTTDTINFLDQIWNNAEILLSAKPQQINISKIKLTNDTNDIEGFYTQDRQSDNYRFLLKGKLDPHILDQHMAPWWLKFWQDYDLKNNPLNTDLDIVGNWKEKDKYFIFGKIQANDFIYKDIPFSSFNSILYAKPHILELNNFSIQSNEGSAQGNLLWLSEKKGKFEPSITKINIESHLPINTIEAFITNPPTLEILKNFNCLNPPSCKLSGEFYLKQPRKNNFTLLFKSNSPLEIKQLPLDYLSFNTSYNFNSTAIDNITLGFAGGQAQATAKTKNTSNNKHSLELECKLQNAKYQHALDAIKRYSSKDNTPSSSKPHDGTIDLNIQAKGLLGDLSSYSGDGKIKITNANLGKINMFGILSRMLSVTPLALGSFNLTDIESSFSINKDKVHFPDIEIFGSTAQIRAKGNYKIKTEGLDFIMDVSPLGKMRVPFVSQAFYLLSPLSQSIQIKLNGTSSNPLWDFKITPLGFFKSKGPQDLIPKPSEKASRNKISH